MPCIRVWQLNFVLGSNKQMKAISLEKKLCSYSFYLKCRRREALINNFDVVCLYS